MNTEELHKQYTQLLRGAPDVLTPSKIVRWTPFGKNTVYELINSGKLRSFQYRGSHIVANASLFRLLCFVWIHAFRLGMQIALAGTEEQDE